MTDGGVPDPSFSEGVGLPAEDLGASVPTVSEHPGSGEPTQSAWYAELPPPAVPPLEATLGEMPPITAEQEPPRRGPSRRAIAIVGVVAVITGVLAYLAVHNDSVSNQYRHLDSAEIALVHRLDAQVAGANSEIKSLNAQLATTEAHLSTVANQKAKDLDLLKEASLVAGDQNSCIGKVQILGADLSSSLNTGQPSVQVVQADAGQVATVCEQAQQATQALQGTVNSQS